MPSMGERERVPPGRDDSRVRQRRGSAPYDFGAFHGYRGPRFTPIPDEFLDHQLADLSSAEAKVMLFLFRKTYGYRKSADRVSLAQLEHGTRSSDGTIIDRGTGLSRATIWRALKGLQQKGLIEVHRQTTSAGDADINYYHIREDSGQESGDASEQSRERSRRTPRPGQRSRGAGKGGGEEGSGADTPGSFNNETTPSSELDHPGSRTKPGGGFGSEPTRTDFTRENSTHGMSSDELQVSSDRTTTEADRQDCLSYEVIAREFLKAIGYAKPAAVKRERTIRVLQQLQHEGGYTLDELRAACEIAASMGARGPELIPHVIGRTAPTHPEAEVGERLSQQEEQERIRWQSLVAQFEALPHNEQQELLEVARSSTTILAQRPLDHPLVRAAAIGLLGDRT